MIIQLVTWIIHTLVWLVHSIPCIYAHLWLDMVHNEYKCVRCGAVTYSEIPPKPSITFDEYLKITYSSR